MQYRFNLKFFLILVAVVAVAGVGLVVGHRVQQRGNVRALRAMSERAEEEQKFDRAIRYLARYLDLVPSDTAALHHYGELVEAHVPGGQARHHATQVYQRVVSAD